MNYMETVTNETLRKEIGKRLRNERLNQNITQAALAEKAGIARRTLVGAERGESFTIDTLLSILRVLGKLSHLDLFLPVPEISPVQLSKLKGHQREKASGKYMYPKSTPRTQWVWNEE